MTEEADLAYLITRLSDKRDPVFVHGKRVAKLVCAIVKIIVNKPGALDRNKFILMRRHHEFGYQLLQSVPAEPIIGQVVLQHHERMDGSGYPFGLRGDEIILEARIVTVADVIEAMVSDQVYRSALSMEEALQVIKQNSGLRYDPEVVTASLMVIADEKK